jgi:RND family efflux transporter MFP subunit
MWAVALVVLAACSGPVEGTGKSGADRALPVQIVMPEQRPMTRNVTLSATVEAYEVARLYAKVAGYVKAIDVDIGDRVEQGQALVTLEIPEMAQQYAQAQSQIGERSASLAKAAADAKLQGIVLQRSRQLRQKDAITEQDLDEARARKAAAEAELALARAREGSAQGHVAELEAMMEYASLRAPFDGIVTKRFVDRGALVQAATTGANISPVVTVARTDTVRVAVDVPEPDVPFIDRNDEVVLVLNALPGKTFEGRVSRFSGALDPSSRTMRTEVDFPNETDALLPGMFGSLTLGIETNHEALTLPEAAVQRGKRAAVVFVLEDGRAKQRQVRLGVIADGYVEILEGVTAGEQAIVAPPGKLSDGREVQVTAREGSAATN